MNAFIKKIIIGALMGLVSAIAFDLQKWKETPGYQFDVKLALERWFKGAATGAFGALGLEGVQ